MTLESLLAPGVLGKALFEVNLLLLFGVCFLHSWRAHGGARTLREFSAGFALTALAESTGVLSGAYVYPGFRFYIFATPVGNPASWVALVYVIMKVSERIVFGRRALVESAPLLGSSVVKTLLALALFDAMGALLLDLVLDPMATIYNWWIWVPFREGLHTVPVGEVDPYNFERLIWMATPENPVADFFGRFFEGGYRYPTRLLGIPLINFIAWAVFVFVLSFEFRWVERQQAWSEWRRTATLLGFVGLDWPILSFLLIAPNI